MKVLSLLQPWATLVVMGVKKIETRSWGTHHRGALLIHASGGKAGALLAAEDPFRRHIPDFNRLPFGAIIGQVDLVQVSRLEALDLAPQLVNRLSLEERAFGDYGPGRFAWLLENPLPFARPLPARGTLRLWDYDL